MFRGLILTSSVDWTVKLWSLTHSPEPIVEMVTPSYDYVCCVEWSPANSPLFATITSGGSVNIWNLSKSVIDPVDTLVINKFSNSTVSSSVSSKQPQSVATLNKFAWMKDGRKLVVGDSSGVIHVVSVNESVATARPGDESKFESFLFSHKGTPFTIQ